MDVTEYLNQDETWITSDGEESKIQDMSPDHAAHAARWLMQNATGFILIVEAKRNEDAVNGEGDVSDVLSLVARSPRDWMTHTPLYRALMVASSGRIGQRTGPR